VEALKELGRRGFLMVSLALKDGCIYLEIMWGFVETLVKCHSTGSNEASFSFAQSEVLCFVFRCLFYF